MLHTPVSSLFIWMNHSLVDTRHPIEKTLENTQWRKVDHNIDFSFHTWSTQCLLLIWIWQIKSKLSHMSHTKFCQTLSFFEKKCDRIFHHNGLVGVSDFRLIVQRNPSYDRSNVQTGTGHLRRHSGEKFFIIGRHPNCHLYLLSPSQASPSLKCSMGNTWTKVSPSHFENVLSEFYIETSSGWKWRLVQIFKAIKGWCKIWFLYWCHL